MTSIGSSFITQNAAVNSEVNSAFNQSAETYLQLFLTQLQNQDPTQPFETAELTASLSQLTNSQQLIEVNDSINKLVEIQTNTNASSITSMIDKKVQYAGDEFYYSSEFGSKFSYVLDQDYVNAQVNILDKDGEIVYFETVDGSQGLKDFEWDGKDKEGNQLAEGEYSALIYGIDGNKDSIPQKTLVEGVVIGVDFASSSDPIIKLSTGIKETTVSLSDVASISTFNEYKINTNNQGGL